MRFDLNDYTIPHTHVLRTLTVYADQECVRVTDGSVVLASHHRSYDKGAQVEELPQRTSFDELRDEIDAVVVVVEVEDREKVRVPDGDRTRFAAEGRQEEVSYRPLAGSFKTE